MHRLIASLSSNVRIASASEFLARFAGEEILAIAATRAPADTGAQERLAALIAELGDDDYHRREAAAAELKSLGPTAIDALLAAAETSGDLEIALRARWLVETIPFEGRGSLSSPQLFGVSLVELSCKLRD